MPPIPFAVASNVNGVAFVAMIPLPGLFRMLAAVRVVACCWCCCCCWVGVDMRLPLLGFDLTDETRDTCRLTIGEQNVGSVLAICSVDPLVADW